MNLNQQIEELQVKANKYDNLSERYVKYAEELDMIIEQLTDLRKRIDPFVNSEARGYIGRGLLMEAINELHKLLISGSEVTREFVEKTYPDFNVNQTHYIMQQLKNRNGILQRKDGNKSILYVQKEM